MSKTIIIAFVAAVMAFAWFSLPVLPPPEPSGGHANHAGDPAAFAGGVVVSVDGTAKAVTISHGPLANLGMPPMIMTFRIQDAAMLERVKAGDKVRFHADIVGGELTVMKIEPAN